MAKRGMETKDALYKYTFTLASIFQYSTIILDNILISDTVSILLIFMSVVYTQKNIDSKYITLYIYI